MPLFSHPSLRHQSFNLYIGPINIRQSRAMWWRTLDWSAVPVLSVAAIIAGWFVAYAIPSIAIMVLCGFLLLTAAQQMWTAFRKDRFLIALTFIFFINVFSGLVPTDDYSFWLERVRIKLPFLALPVAFAALRGRLTLYQFHLLLYLFVFMSIVTATVVLSNLLHDIDELVVRYQRGQVVDIPFSHVRYSLMIAFACLCAAYLYQQGFVMKFRWERWALLGACAFLAVFLHVLAVRSGLLAFYICLIYLAIRNLWHMRKPLWAIGWLAAVLVIPLLSYLYVPTLRAKVHYMRYDLEQLLKHGTASHYSDGSRIISMQKAWELFREHPWTGTGIGNLRREMVEKMEHAQERPTLLMPHNQFLYVAAGTGVFGLAVFVYAVFLPFTIRRLRQHWLLVSFLIIILSSFLTDATIEEQMGTVFYLTMLLLFYVCVPERTRPNYTTH